jgi:hypothetical protein
MASPTPYLRTAHHPHDEIPQTVQTMIICVTLPDVVFFIALELPNQTLTPLGDE